KDEHCRYGDGRLVAEAAQCLLRVDQCENGQPRQDQQGHGVDAQFLRGKQQDRHQGDAQYQRDFDCHACFPQARQLTIACSLRNRGGKNDKAEHELGFVQIGAQEKTRTSTAVRPLAPEASVSTNFTTWAGPAVVSAQVQSPEIGAQEKTRTSTAVRPLAPEASVSTNFTTWAGTAVGTEQVQSP